MEQLRYKRGNVKGKLTRFQNYLDNVGNTANVTEVKVRRDRFENCYTEFDEIQSLIEQQEESLTHNQDREKFENDYFKTLSCAEELIARLQSNRQVSRFSATAELDTQIKLPVIKLPTFSGAYDQWLTFHDTFSSMIDGNSALSSIQKFHYLRSSLQGEAQQVIESLETSSDNYSLAWNLIKERFQNKKLITQSYVKALFDEPRMARENASQVRQFLDRIQKNIRALKSLGQPTDSWDTLVIYMSASKLDNNTRREWELRASSKTEMPKLEEFFEFLRQRCIFLESIDRSCSMISNQHAGVKGTQHNASNMRIARQSYVTSHSPKCTLCKKEHNLFFCETFLNLSTEDRIKEVRRMKLCYNCLGGKHMVSQCSRGHCKNCGKKHNTLLHMKVQKQQNSDASNASSSEKQVMDVQPSFAHCANSESAEVLLSTAVVEVFTKQGHMVTCRALLDSASQSNFISKQACESLGLDIQAVEMPIRGINNSSSKVTQVTTVKLRSRFSQFTATLHCLVIPKITDNLPSCTTELKRFSIPSHINLADPTFYKSRPIDLLMGAGIFFELLCSEQIKTTQNGPTFQRTHLGWIVAGNLPSHQTGVQVSCNLVTNDMLHNQMQQFWETEELSQVSTWSKEEEMCEQHFRDTYHTNKEGRFVVRLPFNELISDLSLSKSLALKRFYSLERSLDKVPELKKRYHQFMREYAELGHMELVSAEKETEGYYLPHHSIIKEESVTTKLRVVFDGSAKTNSGSSLNEALLKGPVIQDDLISILLRFRMHHYVFTADIEKMYRQVQVHQQDVIYQKILWRFDPSKPVNTYVLHTVTYGTTSAPFLATRCLKQVALDNKLLDQFAAQTIEEDFYVDDMITGTDDVQRARLFQIQITNMCQRNGFHLRKWRSNHSSLITKDTLDENYTVPSNNGQEAKTLGIMWNSKTDHFSFYINIHQNRKLHTKRTILSDIAKIFDPLGLLGPVITRAKLVMQLLWQSKMGWDDALQPAVLNQWLKLHQQFANLNKIIVTRRITEHDFYNDIQLHGFSDASESAYGACIYIRTTNDHGKHSVRLLCSKSRVAPLKSISLPRLELCAALLLANLFEKCKKAIRGKWSNCWFWTDSTIVLAWIAAPASTWKTFVANRVAAIQRLTNDEDWRHIRTHDNPADAVSRGQLPDDFINNKQWWNGPQWLRQDEKEWPCRLSQTCYSSEKSQVEQKRTTVLLVTNSWDKGLFEKYSCISKMTRIFAYVLRFIHNIRNKLQKQTACLTSTELNSALTCIVKGLQLLEFRDEIALLKIGKAVNNASKLLCLNPFLDANGVIRVGGRLRKHSAIAYDHKHPMVLPGSSHVTKLLIQREHRNLLHAGPQATLASLRTKFWPLSGRKAVRHVTRNCIACWKVKPAFVNPFMGDLPIDRITGCRAFLKTGIDYCGPIQIRESRRRGRMYICNSYIAVFVCLATKAVHLELVCDLTTEAFLAALRRFMARRGKCTHLYSDNATNFVKANKDLQALVELFKSEVHWNTVQESLADDNIAWKFIPPRAPHFGGLWEAAVKSLKYHLRRITRNAVFTYEEYVTFLVQIEACLNSRPLTPLSNDPNDLTALTPAHFLIGDSLTSTPEPDYKHLPESNLSRWKLIQQVRQHFWDRWQREYLCTLQQRGKWRQQAGQIIQEGALVLLKEDNQPPLQWKMGRIITTYPGEDGVVRVVLVKTVSGCLKRAVAKISVLPLEVHS